jgi:peptidoglycan/xylan/chitin deacetylase (PgdA/CDA1 family)
MTSWRTVGKRALTLPMALARPLRTVPTRWVLTFHEVGDHAWAVTQAAFEDIVAAVAGAARLVSLEDLLAAPDDGALKVSITFDDGYLGVATRALPALARSGVPATVFLPTDLLGEADGLPRQDRGLYRDVPLMGWATVRRLAASSALRFESHGAGHLDLSSLSPESRARELTASRTRIERETGAPARFVAYPFGAADERTTALARECGYEAGFTTRHGGLTLAADRFRLPRADVRADATPRDVLSIVRGRWDFLSLLQGARGRRRRIP